MYTIFKKLITIDDAKKILLQNLTLKSTGSECISLSEAYGRVLTEDVNSPLNIPPFNRSTADGYAVNAADTFAATENRPVKLKFIGKTNVGEAPRIKVKKGTAVGIVTGAPIPEGASAVVMGEYTILEEKAVLIHKSVSYNENIMKAGSDIQKGENILKKGMVLLPNEIGVLAAIGSATVKVHKRPKVAVLSTGAEVVEPGKLLAEGKIFDINSHSLSAAVADCGAEPINTGIVQDEQEQMKTALGNALNIADAVITSGGVSVGPTDIIPTVLDSLGKPGVIVYGIAIKPGKPTTIAVINNKPIFSLPGHPTSSLITFHLFVRPILISMAGKKKESPYTLNAVTSERFFSSRGRRTYVTVRLEKNKTGEIVAYPVPTGLSGAITTLAKADGFVVIHESQQFIEEAEKIEVKLFKPSTYQSLVR